MRRTVTVAEVMRRERVFKLLLVWTVAFLVTLLISGNIWKTSLLLAGPASKTPRAYMEEYMLKRIEDGASYTDTVSCGDRKNLTAVVLQYRALINKLIEESANDIQSISNIEPKDICLLPENILYNERLYVMVDRVNTMKRACDLPDEVLQIPIRPLRLLEDAHHHLLVCRNPKVASTTVGMYLNVLHVYNVMNKYMTVLQGITTHYLIRKFSIPPVTLDDTKKVNIEDDFSFPTVRDPFQRTLSCYLNKIIYTRHYRNRTPLLYAEMLKYTKLSPTQAKKYFLDQVESFGSKKFQPKTFSCSNPVKVLTDETFRPNETTSKTRPDFRGFVMGIATSIIICGNNITCLEVLELHYRPQSIKCCLCTMKYDAIVKSETLQEDLEFVEEILDLPPAYQVLQKVMARNPKELQKMERAADNPDDEQANVIRANVSKRDKTFAEYMSELSEFEMFVLYTAYYHDFIVFGYDPCAEL